LENIIVLRNEAILNQEFAQQQKLYLDYAHAAEAYNKMPTLENWEKKELAFENYNALIGDVSFKI